jgi:hypothetical protein
MISRFQMAETLRAHRVETFLRCCWQLEVACSLCRKGRALTCDELASRFPPQTTAGQVLDRLVCPCGGREGAAMVTQMAGEQQRRDIARYALKG